jgi:Major tropism determinant N-terminal domain
MTSVIRLKRGTAAQWTSNNPVLGPGEQGWERDTNKIKIGDGTTAWSSLPYFSGGGGGGGIAESFETVSSNLDASDATLAYSGGNLTSITYANGIVKTLSYSGGNLTSVVLSGATPGGIDLTKTLTYTGSDLTGVSYS